MGEPQHISSLQELLDKLAETAHHREEVSIAAVHEMVGRRAFGPALLIPGMIAASPLSGIPGTPTVVGLMVLLIAGQIVLGRREFWLPKFVLKRSVSRQRFEKAVKFLRPVARLVDKLIKPRLRLLADGPAVYVIAALCLLMSLTAPLLELLPFAITGVGAAVTAFGLALMSQDGLLSLLACLAIGATGTIAAMQFF